MPQSNTDKFLGRKRELEALHQKLESNNSVMITAAVEGMGGVGKTELAIQYSLHHLQLKTYSGGICWLLAREEDVGLQILQFATINLGLEPPGNLKLLERVSWCWTHWHQENTLLVLDDVKNYNDIKPYLPPQPSQFKVLITTRLKLDLASSMYLEVLPESDALLLLDQLIGEEKKNQELAKAQELCQRLGYLPLALQLVGRYVKKRKISLAEILRRLEEKGLGHPSLVVNENHATWTLNVKRGVAAAFELSWSELNDNESAQELGCLLSLFALAPIPWSLVESATPEQDSEALEDARVELENLHLLQDQKGENTFQLHQLIREFLRDKQNKLASVDKQKSNLSKALAKVVQDIPNWPDQESIKSLKNYIPHLEEVVQNFTDVDIVNNYKNLILVCNGLGSLYKAQGAYAQAIKLLNRVLEISPNDSEILIHRGEIYQHMKRYDQALSDLNRALEINPDDSRILTLRGGIYQEMRHYDQTLADFNRALEISPNDSWILTYRGETYKQMKRYEEALTDLNHALKISPNDSWILTYRNLLYQEMKRYEEALIDLNRALEISPNNSWILTHRGLLYREMNRYEEALTDLNHALETGPNSSWILTHRGSLYQGMNRYEEALTDLNRALEISPNDSWILTHRSLIYQEMNRYEEALADLNHGLKISTDYTWILTHRGLLYQKMERYEEALADLNRALEISPNDSWVLTHRGLFYQKMGRYEEALADLNRALEISPNDSWVLNHQSLLYQEIGRFQG
ncbi:tetratricopeptide repeat protein [Nostoc sp.]|uniref:tetratricopeptide repeat protein n=1 Tax=Nostoc sp. TaxID=1180 RepID=UPI002FF515BF